MQRGVFVVQYTLWGDIVPRLCRVACIASAAFPAPTGGAAFCFYYETVFGRRRGTLGCFLRGSPSNRNLQSTFTSSSVSASIILSRLLPSGSYKIAEAFSAKRKILSSTQPCATWDNNTVNLFASIYLAGP